MRKNAKKLCIVGSAPSKVDAPYEDKSFDIWAIGGAVFSEALGGEKCEYSEQNSWNDVKRVDAFFEMHRFDNPQVKPRVPFLAKCGKPVVTLAKCKAIPTSEAYPVEEIAEEMGEDFSSSIAYMLAYGIYLGYVEIRLYGIVLMHDTEYVRQRPGVKYYIGFARAKGINVWAPENTMLTSPGWRYGYDDLDVTCAKILVRKEAVEAQIEEQKKKIEEDRSIFFQMRGAALQLEAMVTELKGGLG